MNEEDVEEQEADEQEDEDIETEALGYSEPEESEGVFEHVSYELRLDRVYRHCSTRITRWSGWQPKGWYASAECAWDHCSVCL